MSGNLLSFIGWSFLPNLVTGWVQTIYYGVVIRAGEPKPQPGSARYVKHRRRIHILVISLYLLYTIYEADWEVRRAGDFYETLSLRPDVEEKEIKSRFRRLAALHHPDKQPSGETRALAEAYFVQLKLAQDTLLDSTKRFAYERFGPDVTQWRHCATARDYIMTGVQSIIPYYVAGLLFMIVLTTLGYLEGGRYWRYFSTISLLMFELHTITRPYFPPIFKLLNPILTTLTNHPPFLPFQLLILGRKLIVTLFIAFAQLGPLLRPSPTTVPSSVGGDASSTANVEIARLRHVDRLHQLSKSTEAEATHLLGLEMNPFAMDQQALRELRASIRDWLVQSKIKSHPDIVNAVQSAMARRAEQSTGF